MLTADRLKVTPSRKITTARRQAFSKSHEDQKKSVKPQYTMVSKRWTKFVSFAVTLCSYYVHQRIARGDREPMKIGRS